jgi:recombination protein RecR
MSNAFKHITQLFQKLPGIGPRHAARIVLALMSRPPADVTALGTAIIELNDRIRQCTECFNVAENLPEESVSICTICRDRNRQTKTIMVVEKVTDLESVERAGVWRGLYHVLGGALSPIDQLGPEHLRIRELAERADRILQHVGSLELILATNATSSGEMTAMYIRDLFAGMPGVRITRLARGLATGTHLEYVDETTLKYALESRK